MKQILVSGSTAFDTHMYFSGSFQNIFEDEGLKNFLNFSLVAEKIDKQNGGTGANIAYNLALLGEHAILVSSIGEDFSFEGPIREKINLKYIHKQRDIPTANSVIFSDMQDNRMTMFHSGAMRFASESKISYIEESISIALVSANHIPTMLEHARELSAKKIPFFADPAQQISQMSHDELRELIELSNYLIVNHYEFHELQLRSGLTEEDLREKFKYIIVTYGAEGSQLLEKDSMVHIPAVSVIHFEDSTGAGDAYRAGLLFGIIEGMEIKQACQLGSVLAGYCIITSGAQSHHFSYSAVMEDMKNYYGVEIDLYNKRKY